MRRRTNSLARPLADLVLSWLSNCDKNSCAEGGQSQNLSKHRAAESFGASLWLCSLGVESVSGYHVPDLPRDWEGRIGFDNEETDSSVEDRA